MMDHLKPRLFVVTALLLWFSLLNVNIVWFLSYQIWSGKPASATCWNTPTSWSCWRPTAPTACSTWSLNCECSSAPMYPNSRWMHASATTRAALVACTYIATARGYLKEWVGDETNVQQLQTKFTDSRWQMVSVGGFHTFSPTLPAPSLCFCALIIALELNKIWDVDYCSSVTLCIEVKSMSLLYF